MPEIKPLEPDALYRRCDPSGFNFETTDELEDLSRVLGQKRAMEAVRFGIGMPRDGYGLYALGTPGSGRRALIDRFLHERAAGESCPPDWLYVNNFRDSRKPVALALPPGRGVQLRDGMKQLIEDLQAALPAAFESEEYRARRKELEQTLEEEQGKPFEKLDKKARKQGLLLIRTNRGMAFAPKKDDDEVMPADQFNELPEDQREAFRKKIEKLEEDLEKIIHQVPRWQREGKRKIRALDRDVSRVAVENIIEDMQRSWNDQPAVLEYLDAVVEDVIDNVDDFLDEDGEGQQNAMLVAGQQKQKSFRRYRVNVLVENGDTDGAPVVFVNHPSHQNLFGRIEHTSHMGNLFTDFTLIKGGALHRANGGYLVVEARKLLTQPFAWEGLKRTLFSGELKVESLGQELSLIDTVSLEPEALELDIKVILIGSRLLYYLLNRYEPEFGQLFKVAADFEDDMPRTEDSQNLYARMIATQSRRAELLPLDREATARVIEQAARAAEDAERLSVQLQGVTDLLRESDFWAREHARRVIARADVETAIEARRYRAGRVPERIQEAIRRGTLLIETDGARVGQINGLSVSSAGQVNFGHASRITARVRLGDGEVKDIQREVKLAGPIFSKAVMTLTGYLGAHYAPDFPLMVGASLVFEQTYGGIEGDSATAAELFALLSALAGVPLKQALAVTGSANQYGDVQAIGGVNEKIEGFFETCRQREFTGSQGVLVPSANVKHLMLRADVVDAVREGRFNIYPFSTIDEGLGLVTGRDAGKKDARGRFPDGTVNDLVQRRLLEFAEQARRWRRRDTGPAGGERD
ncbi:MAG: AAA family ATPase [Wenzhouxiangellaceae bacterium]|nr:AAA family ATPase [Wenzhouxiangellaceae bacterium]MBS3824444.1 AAA family ATPase [Wenzhouxiangellaceae bacterium]